MEQLMDVIEELEKKKAELLDRKEDNIREIEKCDDKIAYLSYIITQYNWGQKVRREHIRSCKTLLDMNVSHNNNLLSFYSFDGNLDAYIESRISRLEEENEELESSKSVVAVQILAYRKEKILLNSKNRDIDLKILDIDSEIEFKKVGRSSDKIYKKERGNQKW